MHNAIVWQDRRGAALCGELSEQGYDEMVANKTGLVIDAYFSGSKVAWLLENVEGLKERAQNGEVALGTIDTWLIYKLTGGREHVTDYSNASRTLMYSIFDLKWDDELLECRRRAREMLPEIKPSSVVYGNTDSEVFGAGVLVAGVAGDQQAALFGEVAFEKGLDEEHLRHRFLRPHEHGHRAHKERAPADDHRLGPRRRAVEYALEGAIFITGRCGAVAAWTASASSRAPRRQRSSPRASTPTTTCTSSRRSWASARRTGTPTLGAPS